MRTVKIWFPRQLRSLARSWRVLISVIPVCHAQQHELKQWADAAIANPGRAWRAGVPLALGTDGGPGFDPDTTARGVMRDVASGVPAAAAIQAATGNSAAALGMHGSLGEIRPGYIADITAIDADPLQDVERLRKVAFVMRHGTVYKSASRDE